MFNVFFFFFCKLGGYLSFSGKVGMNMESVLIGKISEMENVNMG